MGGREGEKERRTLLHFESSVKLVGSGNGHDLFSEAGICSIDSGQPSSLPPPTAHSRNLKL